MADIDDVPGLTEAISHYVVRSYELRTAAENNLFGPLIRASGETKGVNYISGECEALNEVVSTIANLASEHNVSREAVNKAVDAERVVRSAQYEERDTQHRRRLEQQPQTRSAPTAFWNK